MFCPKCGATLPEGSIFCPSCGFNLSSGFDSPAENVVYPLEKAKKTFSDPLFLAIAILLSVSVAAGFFSGGLNIFLALFVVGVWMIYAGTMNENNDLIGRGLSLSAVATKISYVITYVLVGILLFLGVILFLMCASLGNAFGELANYTFDTFDQVMQDAGVYVNFTAEQIDIFNKTIQFISSLSGVAIGAIFLGITVFCSAVSIVLNVLFVGRFTKFLKNASLAAKEGRTVEISDRRCAIWVMVYGIYMAIKTLSTFAATGSIFVLVISGCLAAACIMSAVLMRKEF